MADKVYTCRKCHKQFVAKEEEKEVKGIKITTITITNDEGEKKLSKPKGKYISISAPGILYDSKIYEKTVDAVSEIIKEFRDTKKSVLVAGLGNRSITPDALGPEVVSRIFVTRHMKGRLDFDFVKELGDVSAIAPGVLGTTGLKTSKILKGIVNIEKPELIIAVDAYCAKSLDRISNRWYNTSRTVQHRISLWALSSVG
jgi:spore protease